MICLKKYIYKKQAKMILRRTIEHLYIEDFLASLSNRRLYRLGRAIVWNKYDGYNYLQCVLEEAHFGNMDRWQKKFYVQERIYVLLKRYE